MGITTAQRRFRATLIAACSALLSSAPYAATCTSAVSSGFNGDLNMLYGDGYGGADGSGNGSGDGDSGAGAGAGEGKVIGALVTVTRIADGSVIGSAVTDSTNGLVKIKPCVGDFPVLITLTGQSGTMYFDEGTNQITPFPAGRTLHALVDTLDENVAVSALTEAAYRYALNNFILNPADVRARRTALASTGDVRGLTIAQVRTANGVVLAEINRVQTTNLQLTTIKSLPTPIDSGSGKSALPNNRYGVSASVLGGLAAMGKGYVANTPAIVTGEQLARDLTDGKLDGFALDGSPAAAASAIGYDAVRFPIAASVGANAISSRFGATTTLARAAPIAEVSSMAVQQDPNGNSLCTGGSETSTLQRDATVSVVRIGCGQDASIPTFATDARLVEGSGIGQPPRTFLVKSDGTLWGWGDTRCGLLGNGDFNRTFLATPVQITGVRDVTAIASGSWFTIARTSDGSVYTWGINYEGELGMGLHTAAPGSVPCANEYYPVGHQYRSDASIARPTRIPSLSDIVTVATDRVTAFALDKAGNVYEWGLIPVNPDPQPFGTFDTVPFPRKVAGLPPTVAVAASYYMKMALVADGTLYGFGPNVNGNFGDGTVNPHLAPTRVPNLGNVVEIAASGDSPFVALLQDGTSRYWGGCCGYTGTPVASYLRTTPTAPVAGSTPFYSATQNNFVGTLPRIRHLKGSGSGVLLYGSDGSLYQFPKSQTEHVFVLIAAGTSAPTPSGTKATAVEYYHAAFDHYFITTIADEITKLDNGTFAGWSRTGQTFSVFSDTSGGASGVCRFFSTSFAPKSSHFYTPDVGECGKVKGDKNWQFEGVVFSVSVPDGAGNCPAGSQPIYRLYNNGQGAAPNHRYTTSTTLRTSMLARGWIPEGYGALGVVMCAPN